ncbi:hypothetical protein OIE66_17865 [Nonomuraea sp. NBC_01738]|uniref:hypothetical protein n=1 Tax=Nonomuraea sp. NBC_01738 TaxID=2976003 RepID=UPI002E122533|nr:hypothetical protein OIE66_17865 [Nonomuraea sp. NBC_01738]
MSSVPARAAGDDSPLVVDAMRLERRWVTLAGDHGIVVHGTTLCDLHKSVQRTLMLLRETSSAAPGQVRPQSAEIDTWARARGEADEALGRAVRALRADGVPWTDIALACGVRPARARRAGWCGG